MTPYFDTDNAEAAEANRAASLSEAFSARATPRDAVKVSPAPVVSTASAENEG